MKNILLVAMPVLSVLVSLMGCMPDAMPTATVLPATATPTAFSTSTPSTGPWQVVRQAQCDQSTNQAGFHDDSFGIAVGYNGAVSYTTDGGQNWSKANNTSWCRFGLDIVNQQTAWNCGNAGHMRLSTDGGKNWQAVANFGGTEPDQCRFLRFLDARTGWAASPRLLGATADGGTTWKTLALPKDITDLAAIDLRTATDGYLLDVTGTVFLTTDGGETWSTRSLGLAGNEKLTIARTPTAAIRFTDAQNGMVVYDLNEKVFSARTVDGGQTWKREPVGTTYKSPTLYLAHDGLTLTAIDAVCDLTVFRYQEP